MSCLSDSTVYRILLELKNMLDRNDILDIRATLAAQH